jgi:dipeptidyl aminopeptidase/acylaminoacyl peptidase
MALKKGSGLRAQGLGDRVNRVHKPYGTWPSPVTAAVVAAQGLRLGSVAIDGDDVYWLEGRPGEGGRSVLVRRGADGTVADVTPEGYNVRSRVHEYGGGAYAVADGTVYFSNFSDQRIYRAGGEPEPITPAGDWFYADAIVDRARRRVVCVREEHTAGASEPVNALVSIALDGEPGAGDVIASGYDFYASPRLNPDQSKLAWICWRHPQMPWDGTELWVADVGASGRLEGPVRVAGGDDESIYQPGWSPDGVLHFVSDRDGWWQLYRLEGAEVVPVVKKAPESAEFGRPQWVFGTSTWAFAGRDRIAASYTIAGHWHLATIDVATGTLKRVNTPLEPRDWLTVTATHAVMIAASPTSTDVVATVDLTSGATETLRAAATVELDPADISVPEPIEFPTTHDRTAHAFYYPPRNSAAVAAEDERPPLIVISHSGPTTAAGATLDLKVQFWTTRGFAVVDVNYGGSSGYGREYRQRLNGRWGIVDVADVVAAARYLVSQGKADPNRLIIRGGSAGGYTTLAALTFAPDVFKAGASYYGISDIEMLAQDTHKFESRYLDSMIGPYPKMKEEYRARSPIHFIEHLSCPLILFQGLEDKVVPPNQSEMMASAVRSNGWPVAYLSFEGEQHGFRKAETIIRSLEAELFFYAAVFGFAAADAIEPIQIDNLPVV